MTAGTGVAAGCQESAGYGPRGLPGQMPHTRVLALPAVTPVPPAGGVGGALLRSPARAGVSDRLRSRVGVQAGVPSCHQLLFTQDCHRSVEAAWFHSHFLQLQGH